MQSVERDLGRHPKAPRDCTVVLHSCHSIESCQRLVRQQHTCSDAIAPRFFATSAEQAVTARQCAVAEKQVSKLVHEGEVLRAIRFVGDVNEN